MNLFKKLFFIFLVFSAIGFAACEEEGPLEKAGKKGDEAVEETGEKLEEAGDKLQDSADK